MKSARERMDIVNAYVELGSYRTAAYESRSLAIASRWPFDQRGHFLPDQATAAAMFDATAGYFYLAIDRTEPRRNPKMPALVYRVTGMYYNNPK